MKIRRDAKGRLLIGRWNILIQCLIILSLVSFSIETLPNLPPWLQSWLGILEILIISVFTIEYILRVALSRPSLSYVFSFFGIIDLIAILPFYLTAGLDLRAARAFRLLRLFRLLKLFRYSKAMQRLHRAALIAKEEVVLFGLTAAILLYLASVGIYYFEREAQPDQFGSIFHAMWWAIVTFTTVGYGDVYPITVGGKIFTGILLMIGVGIVAVPAGLFASALSKAREIPDEEYEVPEDDE